MKKSNFSTAFKTGAIALLCLFLALSSVSAQTGGGKKAEKRFDYDVSETIASLPAKDGTYLVKTDKTVNIYAVMKDGQLSAIEFKDKTGKIIPSQSEPAPPSSSSERVMLKCSCCIPSGCIWYGKPCDRCNSPGSPGN